MISKEDLDYLKQLDELRVEARAIRDRGLKALVAFSTEDHAHWEQEISDNEKLLFRRAKHLAWNLGKIEEYDCESFDIQHFSKQFKKPQSRPQTYPPRVNYPEWPVIVSPVLRKSDITDPVSLYAKLKDSTDPLSKYLRRQLKTTLALLNTRTEDLPPDAQVLRALLKELNNVLPSPLLQDYVVKANVQLRQVTKSLLARRPLGAELLRLNRMLLGDAYGDEITRGCRLVQPLEIRCELRELDIIDRAGFCTKLKDRTNPLSRHLRGFLSEATRNLLKKYTSSTPPSSRLINAILEDLNRRLPDLAVKKYARKMHVTQVLNLLQPDEEVGKDPQGEELRRFNRTLLAYEYPDEIKLGAQSVELFKMPGEPAPMLFAANFLRTRLGNLHGCLDEGTLSCYYRVIRELYNLHNTNWALGAARPGEHSGKPSVFVTTECARSIGFFARLMENTAHFLRRIHETKEYVQHVKCAQDQNNPLSLDPVWCASELNWCAASVKTTIEGFRDYVAILLPDLKEVSHLNDAAALDEMLSLIEDSVKYFADQSAEAFSIVIKWIKLLREREQNQFYKWRLKERKHDRETILFRELPERDLTETAHRVAWGALAAARQDFKKLQRTCRKAGLYGNAPRANDGKVLQDAAVVFADLAKWLRTHLDPSKEYFEKNLHRCLSENARRGNPNIVQDLAFSALSLGLITKEWHRPDCRQAIEIMCENLDEGGKFPVGPPFAYTAKGEGRVVINAQVIRAFAQLVQHLPANLSPEIKAKIPTVVKRMLGYFESQSIELELGIAWPSLRALNRERSSLWVSSISVLALHRIVLMLDAHINHGVKEHFHTRTPSELKQEGVPYLHELMCSDIGYVSLNNHSQRSARVVMELEGMRAHLLGTGRAKKALQKKEALGALSLRSLILYGPPGTGKTTLVKSLAVTSNVDVVEVMAHDLYGPGTERVMEQASHVMDALKLLTSTVILFDEFEPILHLRPEHPVRITEMLTGNMLPKLDALYKSAEHNGIAYILLTNYVERLDSAAIRVGRFDRLRFIYYPDAASRVCRLVSELGHLMNRLKAAKLPASPDPGYERRLMEVAAKTARRQINHLCRTGWFVAPRDIKTVPAPRPVPSDAGSSDQLIAPETDDKLGPVWKYIIWDKWSNELDWDRFDSAENPSSDSSSKAGSADKESPIVDQVRNWDDELRKVIYYDRQASWQRLIDLISKPIDNGKSDSEPTPTTC